MRFIIYYLVLILNPMGRILVCWISFRNNLEILCHPICNRLCSLLYVECHLCMWSVIYVCGVSFLYCMWNVIYFMWSVIFVCGVSFMYVECHFCMWSVIYCMWSVIFQLYVECHLLYVECHFFIVCGVSFFNCMWSVIYCMWSVIFLLHVECHLISISSLNLLGLFSIEHGKRDLEN